MDRVILTGSHGFIGSAIRNELTRGYSVDKKIGRDILDTDITEASAIVHVAGQPGVRGSFEAASRYIRDNIEATARVFEWARKCGCPVILFSSSSVYGDRGRPRSFYGYTKLSAEHIAETYFERYGVPSTVLRLFTVYGPDGRKDMAVRRFIEAALDGRTIQIHGDGSAARDFTYVSDVVGIVRRLLSNPFRGFSVHDVGQGQPRTINELTELVRLHAGMVDVVRMDSDADDVRETCAGRNVIQWPYTPLEEGIRLTVDWHLRERRKVAA